MKLLEEKGLREKIINECIKCWNELREKSQWYYDNVATPCEISKRKEYIEYVEKADFALNEISDLRMRLMQLLDNERVE